MGKYLLRNAPKTGTGDLLISVQAIDPLYVPTCPDENLYNDYMTKIGDGDFTVEDSVEQSVFKLYNLDDVEIDYIVHQCN